MSCDQMIKTPLKSIDKVVKVFIELCVLITSPMRSVYLCNILNNCYSSVQLVSPLDLILVLLEMPMIQWMTDMHPQGRGRLGTK